MFRFRLKSLLFLIPVLIIGLAWVVWNNILILDDWHSHTYTAAEAAAMAQLEELSASGSNMADAPQDPNMAPAPDYTPPTKGYHIYINLDIVTMYVYKNGNLIKTYPVSGGKPSTPSPLGTWKIISKDTWGGRFWGCLDGF